MTKDSITVFQDLSVGKIGDKPQDIRNEIIKAIKPPYVHDEKFEKELSKDSSYRSNNDSYLTIDRCGDDEISDATICLLSSGNEYNVINIIPTNNKFSRDEYNAVMQDFVEQVIKNTSYHDQYKLTKPSLTIGDIFSKDAADSLTSFSLGANKGTGSAHPVDKERWNKFLILAHKDKKSAGASTLERVLKEIHGWSDELANELAIEYESAMSLLEAYDESN